MKAEAYQASQLAALLGLLWSKHTEHELTEMALEYIQSEQSAMFAEEVKGSLVGVALCSIRTDYVEGCDTSPVGYLEGVFVTDGFRHQGIAKSWYRNAKDGQEERAARNLPATVN